MPPYDKHCGVFCDLGFVIAFGLALLGNLVVVFFMAVFGAKTSVDHLVLNLAVVEMLLACVAIPVTRDVWEGEPFRYGQFACKGLIPFVSILELAEAFIITATAIYMFERIRGERRKVSIILTLGAVYISTLVMTIPYFGVSTLKPGVYIADNTTVNYCVEDWNQVGSRLFWFTKFVFQFVVPFFCIESYNYKSLSVLKFVNNVIGTRKTTTKYQSMETAIRNNEVEEQQAPSQQVTVSVLKFSESEEMNLEMNQIYDKQHSISTIHKDSERASVSIQIFTNEVTLAGIDCHNPLWRGPIPSDTDEQTQTVTLSIKWFKYISNILRVTFAVNVLFLVSTLPYQVMSIYALFEPRANFSPTEAWVNNAALYLRFAPVIVNPWFFLLGVVKYRKSLCSARCCC